jgi:hypothetical protein
MLRASPAEVEPLSLGIPNHCQDSVDVPACYGFATQLGRTTTDEVGQQALGGLEKPNKAMLFSTTQH